MKFLEATNKELSLYHDALSLLGIPETDTTTFAAATYTRYVNAWYQRMVFYIWRSSGMWQFDDSTATTFPEATTTLVAGQEDYTIPSGGLDVREVYVMNSGGDYQKLRKINPFAIGYARDEYYETDSMPAEYYLEGNSIIIKPAPAAANVTLALGLKIILDRNVTLFAVGDTTKEPGFIAQFHRVLSLGAAYDFARAHNMVTKVATIKPDLDMMVREVEEYFSRRSKGGKNNIRPNLISSI